MKDNCPRRGFGPRGPKTRGGTLGLPALYRGRLAKRECGYFRLIITKKNLDLIACTAARYQRFSRKWSWAASKKTRARGLLGSASLTRALSLSRFRVKRPRREAFPSPTVSVYSIFLTIKGSFEFKRWSKSVKRETVVWSLDRRRRRVHSSVS